MIRVADTTKRFVADLITDSHGAVLPTLSNLSRIFDQDEALNGIVYNEMNGCIDTVQELPWRATPGGWGQNDFACLELYLEKNYGVYAPARCRESLSAHLTTRRRYHPIRHYLDELVWDGKERLDTLLIDYFDAEDSRYTRMVTRKTMVAAVARVYEPGIKFDHVLVLCGQQGIGKSTFFSRLGKEWYSDSMTISDMKDKSACEKMQGVWIMELGELAGIRKIDVEIVKSFITRQTDSYRPAYGQYVETHRRSNIIVGTTNARDGFLRDNTGNRRFWPVVLHRKPGDAWILTDLDVDQIWAEAIKRYRDGEPLYLERADEEEAERRQSDALDVDPHAGLIEEYLSDPEITSICLMELWCACLGRHRQDLKKREAYELEAILRRLGTWEPYTGNSSGKMRFPTYGIQRAFVRKERGDDG